MRVLCFGASPGIPAARRGVAPLASLPFNNCNFNSAALALIVVIRRGVGARACGTLNVAGEG